MRVCFATYDDPQDFGGVSSWLQRVLPALRAAGVELEVHAATSGGKPGVVCAFFKEQGIPVRRIPLLVHLPYAVRSFLRLLEEGQPDVYVPSCVVPAYYAAGYASRMGIPTVGVLHSDDPYYWGIVDQFVYADTGFRVSAVVPVSTFLESQISLTAAARGVMVRRIGYGVPIPERTAELTGSAFRLVYTGRLVEKQKRISDVADALCTVAKNIPDVEAWVVGEGEARPAVENIIRTRGMGARVRLLGRVDNAQINEVLAQCHCLVLLSDYEGLPISVLEAMAAGVVPICLDMRSGIREAIVHGANGLIVKDRAADFFDAVRGLQSDPQQWRRLSLAARETTIQRYSIEECARQWIDLLEHLNTRVSARAYFRAPRMSRLPPPNPKINWPKQSWEKRAKEYIRSTPPLYRVAKATVALGHKTKQLSVGKWHR